MTTLPERFQPLRDGLKSTQNLLRTRVQFGDGYVQNSINTVNPRKVDLSLRFIIWGDEDLNEFLEFFYDLGAAYLTYTLPNEVEPHQYEVIDKNIDYVDAFQRNVTLTLMRVF